MSSNLINLGYGGLGVDSMAAKGCATAEMICSAKVTGVLHRAVEHGVAKSVLLDPVRCEPYLESIFPNPPPPRDEGSRDKKPKCFDTPSLNSILKWKSKELETPTLK